MTWYRMSDRPDAESRAAIPIDRSEAARWNTPDLGFGIFVTVNAFHGKRRKENLRRVIAWAIDMDAGSKEEQRERLLRSPLIPSRIVETKRGYQAWWLAKDGKPEHWNALVLERLVPHFGSDPNARDLCRILRVPGYWHLKDPSAPFKIECVHRLDIAYTERELAEAFTWVPNLADRRRQHASAPKQEPTVSGETLWESIYNLDCAEGLQRLSGHWAVGGETYRLVRAPRGHLNIFVDGKSSSCFIDENRRIGSLSGGGPTLYQWLRWLGRDAKEAIAVLKELFPKLAEIDAAEQTRRRKANLS